MRRDILKELNEWKTSKYRKPLLLQGARQVGKTWLMKEFGRQSYEHTAYFDFEENPELRELFLSSKDPERILDQLRFSTSSIIRPESTLIIFDEIQECPEAITSLKYFCDHAPEYHLVCAGSLLGVALSKPASLPVGKVELLYVEPMTFSEFLSANDADNLRAYVESIDRIGPIPELFYNRLYEQMKAYLIIGGMPEAVFHWAEERDVDLVQRTLKNILDTYERDFAKYPERKDFAKISLVWNAIPSQLSRENKKFMYQVMKHGARAREYEDALQWLVNAGLIYKVFRSSTPRLPLSAYDDLSAFKLYLFDVGLLRRLSMLDPSAYSEGNRLFTEFKGALSENYILQALSHQFEVPLRYWTDGRSRAEIDFVFQRANDIFPVEVKAGRQITSNSLKKYEASPIKIRYSLKNLSLDGDILNIPIFLADQTERLIFLALQDSQ